MLRKTAKFDLIGIVGSGLCLIHCLALPIIFIFLGDSTITESHSPFNFDYLFLSIAFVAVYFSAKKTTSFFIKTSLWSFLLICALGIVFHDYSPYTKYIIYTGSCGLILSHLYNIRFNKGC